MRQLDGTIRLMEVLAPPLILPQATFLKDGMLTPKVWMCLSTDMAVPQPTKEITSLISTATNTGTISTNIATVMNQTYQLSFAYSKNPVADRTRGATSRQRQSVAYPLSDDQQLMAEPGMGDDLGPLYRHLSDHDIPVCLANAGCIRGVAGRD